MKVLIYTLLRRHRPLSLECRLELPHETREGASSEIGYPSHPFFRVIRPLTAPITILFVPSSDYLSPPASCVPIVFAGLGARLWIASCLPTIYPERRKGSILRHNE
jgi:hypothetical protein